LGATEALLMNQTFNNKPLVSYFHNIFTNEECDTIINSSGDFHPSLNYNSDLKMAEVAKIRTSSTYYDSGYKFQLYQRKIYFTLKDKFDFIKGFNISHFEPLSILKYTVGQQYREHKDFFNNINSKITENDRFATAILYLNDDFDGGETFFKHLKITVKPKKGSLLFFDYKYNHELNMLTRHQGLPVYRGTKYIATQWIRYNPHKQEICL
jgi:prolyl 4-hydroxylase